MEPNQNTNMQNATSVPTSTGISNVSSTSLNMPDKSVESSKPGSDVVFQDKPKKNMGMILTIVLLVLLAAGGIGFGVWAMMDGNSQVAKKDEQIAELREQLAEKGSVVVDDTTITNDGDVNSSMNPIIKATSPAQYSIRHSISLYDVENMNGSTMTFITTDGGSLECRYPSLAETGGCSINGVPDGIYKIITIFEGNGIGSEKVGFLMSDGTVWFAPIYNNSDANAGVNRELQAKKANIDGFVKDIVEVSYISDINRGYGAISTVFVMDDNSLIKYDDSLFGE